MEAVKMLKTCPDPVDIQDLQFKLQCRLKVFDNKELDTFPNTHSLVSCASRYGLLFIGSNSSSLQAVQLKCIENYSPKEKQISNYPRRNINLPSPPKHICVNCDSTILAVVVDKDKCPSVIFYDVLSFFKQNISVIKEARLSPTPHVYATEINWNPALPPIFTACKSDGTLGVYEIKGTSIEINELPAAAEATSFCWSPKGKQIAVGSRNGKITQYKPDLKAVKVINEPPLTGAHSLISLQWVSNYQFIGIYQPAAMESTPKLIVVDAPKTGPTSYMNYEDVCYSGSTRLPQFYMILQQHWNIIMIASSNSTELGVLGSTGDVWTQWILPDSARAELPLSSDHQETLPVGLALDVSATQLLLWNESTIPPCPYLLLLSHQGILCIFNMVNLKQNIPSICTPPDPISDMSGISQFITVSENISGPPIVHEQTKTTASGFSFGATPSIPATQASMFGAKILAQPQPTFGTPASVTTVKAPETQTKSLFGGQAVLSPIKPQQPTTQPALFGGQTLITPINKVQAPANTVAPADSGNSKYSSIFSALNAPTSLPTVNQTKPIVITTAPVPKTEPPKEQVIIQPMDSVPNVKSVESKSAYDVKIKGETDALLAQMVKDECLSLESELKALLHQGKSIKTNVGSDAEKVQMISRSDSLQDFIKEIIDISIGENAEVHYLKQNLIQSWAWFEEARSRYNCSKDETMTLLLRSQPLDSATEKREADIRKLMYYIESQITQASKALDEQWDNFQDYAKKTHKAQMPTMEAIFQAMVRQNAILQKQNYVLKDIANRLKHRGRSTNGPPLLVSIENTKDLVDSLTELQIEHPQDIYQIQYEKVLNRMKNLSVPKTNKLRKLLKNRESLHVTVVKPQLSSSLMLQSPTSKSKQLLSNMLTLGAQMSPVSKTGVVPKNLNFIHSTPIRDIKPEIKPASAHIFEMKTDSKPPETPPNTPTQTDLKGFNFKKVEKSNSATNITTSTFVPLAKSTSVYSNLPQTNLNQASLPTHSLSAFVPTTQVTLGNSNKPFSFLPAATTTVPKPLTKTDMVTASAGDAPFSLSSTASVLPKFTLSATAKTTSINVTAAESVKTSTPTTKTSLPQFNFGSSISVTPVTSKKDVSSAPITTTTTLGLAATTKPAFSFGNTNVFSSSETGLPATGKIEILPATTTGAAPLFGNLAQGNKPLFGNTTPSPATTFSFGGAASSSKNSAFSAVTATSAAIPVVTTSASETNVSTSAAPQPSLFTSSSVADSGFVKTTSSIFGNLASPSTPMTAATKPLTVFSTAGNSTKPQSIFGSTTTESTSVTRATTGPLNFSSSAATTKPLAFNVTSTPIAVTTTSTTILSIPGTTATTKSVFGSPLTIPSTPILTTTAVPYTKPTLFGTVANTADTTTTTAPQTQTLFSVATPNTIGLATTTQTTSIFGSSTAIPTTKSLFGATAGPTQPAIFGSASPPVTTQATIFGSATATTQSSIFGVPITTSATNTPPAFGVAPTLTQPSIFGTNTPSTSTTSIFGSGASNSQTSIFGTSTGSSTTQSSIFGTGTTVAPTKPIFGATTSAPSTQSSIFAASSTPATQTSLFHTTSTAAASPFGSAFGSAPTGTTSPPFGQSGSLFGTPTTTASPFGASFGSPTVFGSAPTTTPSIFGQPTSFGGSAQPFGTPTTTTSIFGAGGSTFGTVSSSASVFRSPAVSSSFSFAGAAPNTSVGGGTFGFGGLNVGNTATTSNSVFGGSATFGQSPSTTSNPFGRTAEQKSPFGGGSSSFGSPASTSNSIFGSNTGSTFGSNTQTGFGTSTFGSPSAFGQQPAFGQSSFGQSNASFGSPQPGPFSSGAAVGQSGFGSSPSFQKPTGFGGTPVFGGSPQAAFGAAPSFGGSPAFGAPAAFGSPNKVFGSTTPSAGFGAAATENAGFGNLATQNTVGFGNLAQQAASPNSAPFSGSSSFSSWR